MKTIKNRPLPNTAPELYIKSGSNLKDEPGAEKESTCTTVAYDITHQR